MKFCSSCGAALVDGAASFCSECGKPLQKQADDARIEAKEAATATHNATTPEKTVHKAQAEDEPPEGASKNKRPLKKEKRHRREKRPPRGRTREPAPGPEQTAAETEVPKQPDDGYDGYYEDILPIDEGQRKVEKLDPDTIKKVALIAGGALLLVLIAIVALLLM